MLISGCARRLNGSGGFQRPIGTTLNAGEQAQLTAILARCPRPDALAGQLRAFAEVMTSPQGKHRHCDC
jgi:hypothetical protein